MQGSPNQSPKFCWGCGAPITASQKFCVKCGKPLAKPSQSASDQTVKVASTPASIPNIQPSFSDVSPKGESTPQNNFSSEKTVRVNPTQSTSPFDRPQTGRKEPFSLQESSKVSNLDSSPSPVGSQFTSNRVTEDSETKTLAKRVQLIERVLERIEYKVNGLNIENKVTDLTTTVKDLSIGEKFAALSQKTEGLVKNEDIAVLQDKIDRLPLADDIDQVYKKLVSKLDEYNFNTRIGTIERILDSLPTIDTIESKFDALQLDQRFANMDAQITAIDSRQQVVDLSVKVDQLAATIASLVPALTKISERVKQLQALAAAPLNLPPFPQMANPVKEAQKDLGMKDVGFIKQPNPPKTDMPSKVADSTKKTPDKPLIEIKSVESAPKLASDVTEFAPETEKPTPTKVDEIPAPVVEKSAESAPEKPAEVKEAAAKKEMVAQ